MPPGREGRHQPVTSRLDESVVPLLCWRVGVRRRLSKILIPFSQ